MADTPEVSSGRPLKLTKVKRNLVQISLMLLISVMLSIVLIRRLFGDHRTLTQQSEAKARSELASQNPGRPEEIRARLLQQETATREKLRQDALDKPKLPVSAPIVASGAGAPHAAPLPAAFRVPPTESDAQKLELERARAVMQEVDIGAWEASSHAQHPASSNPTLDALQHLMPVAAAQAQPTPAAPSSDTLAQLAQQSGQAGVRNAALADRQWLAETQQRAGQGDYAPLTPTPVGSPYALLEGDIIKAVVMQGLNTDQPGTVRAMVTRDIYDSVNARYIVMPAGTILIGTQNTDVSVGQSRILLAFQRVRFPSGATLTLGGMPAADLTGAAGLAADVNNHFWQQFGSSFLIAGVAALVGRNQSQPGSVTVNVSGASVPSTLSQAAAQSLSDTVRRMLDRNQTIKPTLTIDPGDVLSIVVTREMDLPPQIVTRSAQ